MVVAVVPTGLVSLRTDLCVVYRSGKAGADSS